MKRVGIGACLALLAALASVYFRDESSPAGAPLDTNHAAARQTQFPPEKDQSPRDGAQFTTTGVVTRILPDDRDGSRHQRFIIELDSGSTLLIAHNIDLAPRLDGLGVGEPVRASGEFAWSPQGGTLHWTHHDPQGRHVPGYIEWRGRRYQ